MRRSRALAALALATTTAALAAGCLGGDDDSSGPPPAATAPAALAAPVAVAAVPPGGTVAPGPATPKRVAAALAGGKVVVVAFLVDGPADDERVAAALRAVRSDRLARGVDFFVFTVGRDRFGDLADLLGVSGTPSIAVIARDRTLANLFTGLTDAEILRQSISDAADTAAANPGATPAATEPRGDARGIALARRADAAYRDVPGVRVDGSFPVPGAGAMAVEGRLRLDTGSVAAVHGTFSLAGVRFEMVGSASSASVRTDGAGCWARLPGSASVAGATPQPAIGLTAGMRVSAPRPEGPNSLVDVSSGRSTVTYVIDRGSGELRAVRTPDGTLTFAALEGAPSMPDPSPVCDEPADALKGLPAALGGTS